MDIKSVLESIQNYFQESAGDKWNEVKEQAEEYLLDTENRLLDVTIEATTGDLSGQFLADRAKDELSILESQALSLGIISASFTQETVNTTVMNLLIILVDELIKRKNDNEA